MSESIEQHDFVETLELQDIRNKLAEWQLDTFYKDRDLFDVFLNGCLGWNNLPVDTCIEEYINTFFCDDDFFDEQGNPIEKRFFVNDDIDKYEVIAVDYLEPKIIKVK